MIRNSPGKPEKVREWVPWVKEQHVLAMKRITSNVVWVGMRKRREMRL